MFVLLFIDLSLYRRGWVLQNEVLEISNQNFPDFEEHNPPWYKLIRGRKCTYSHPLTTGTILNVFSVMLYKKRVK